MSLIVGFQLGKLGRSGFCDHYRNIVLNLRPQMVSRRRRLPKPKEPVSTPAEQHKLFRQTAREIGTDGSEDAFDKVLRKVAPAPPPKTVQKRKSL